MQFVVFISDEISTKVLNESLKNTFTYLKVVNINDKFDVFELENYFKQNEVYFLDLCNSVKSKELICFLLSVKYKTCFDLKYMYRSYFHFKYAGKFFELLNLKSLKRITSHEIKIYNRSHDHTIDLLGGFPIFFDLLNEASTRKIAKSKEEFDQIYLNLNDRNAEFVLSHDHNAEEFLECIFKDQKVFLIYDNQSIKDLTSINDSLMNDLDILSKNIPNEVITFKLVKKNDKYIFDEFHFGVSSIFISVADTKQINQILNLDNL